MKGREGENRSGESTIRSPGLTSYYSKPPKITLKKETRGGIITSRSKPYQTEKSPEKRKPPIRFNRSNDGVKECQ